MMMPFDLRQESVCNVCGIMSEEESSHDCLLSVCESWQVVNGIVCDAGSTSQDICQIVSL
jgi:hypothetical protein